jgi:hypothetical protein
MPVGEGSAKQEFRWSPKRLGDGGYRHIALVNKIEDIPCLTRNLPGR